MNSRCNHEEGTIGGAAWSLDVNVVAFGAQRGMRPEKHGHRSFVSDAD